MCPGWQERRGQPSHICLFISRKGMMNLISLLHRFVTKCQILSKAIQISHHLFSLLLNPELLPFLETPIASCFYQRSSTCLSPLTSLLTKEGYLCQSWQPFWTQPWHCAPWFVLVRSGLALGERGYGWSLPRAWAV